MPKKDEIWNSHIKICAFIEERLSLVTLRIGLTQGFLLIGKNERLLRRWYDTSMISSIQIIILDLLLQGFLILVLSSANTCRKFTFVSSYPRLKAVAVCVTWWVIKTFLSIIKRFWRELSSLPARIGWNNTRRHVSLYSSYVPSCYIKNSWLILWQNSLLNFFSKIVFFFALLLTLTTLM